MDSSESLLMLAIDREDCAEVARLLDKGVNINYIEPTTGYSPLHRAVERENFEIVELLLKRNANVNARARVDAVPPPFIVPPPLHMAAMSGRLDVVTLLISYGASLETKNIFGLLPIHIAAQGGYLNIVKYFIDNELYHVDTCNINLRTPLMYAVAACHTEIIEYLLQCNADVRKADVYDRTALHCACEVNLENVIEILIGKGSSLDVKTSSGETPLHICVRKGYLGATKRLVESGARSYLERGDSGNSLIHLAAQCNQKEMLEYFFKMGISADFQTVDGYSLLHDAATFGRLQMVKFLLKNGANIEGKIISSGTTALHLASSSNHYEVIKVLLTKGADVMAIDIEGRRPLDYLYEYLNSDSKSIFYMKHSWRLLVTHMLLFYKNIEVPVPRKFFYLNKFKQKCQEEIEQMKTCVIENTSVSLYIFLQALRNKTKLLHFLRNHELQEEMNNIKQYIDKYPIYSSLLPMVLDKVRNGKERLLLLEKAGTAMDIIVPELIFECKINILQMLNNEDLSRLIESVKIEFY
ncbi:ankyrin-1 isoform X1 [Diabrotica virgifera virgifera]|uniref:Ankyrin-1-like isoform X1 n=1 Tax=Diabrotica virgifera virgifera TaxID=50390 RepID=A0A6P7H9B3_DIAVI|nr:ankyrin-1 isoform X1 [Diabrotica virgifera virgifera]